MSRERENIVADRLFHARIACVPIPPVRDDLTDGGIDAAYRVQRRNIDRLVSAGGCRVGRKIGLTSEAVQRQLGVDSPDVGILLEDMAWRGDEVRISTAGLIAPRVEAEIAFILGTDIHAQFDPERIGDAVSHVAAAAEIVDSAIENWSINILDTVADNASAGRFALGTALAFKPGMNLAMRRMVMRCDGQVVSSGSGAASLGDPMNALVWLARTALVQGDPLRAGEIILAGALGPMTTFSAATYLIDIDGFPSLTVTGIA